MTATQMTNERRWSPWRIAGWGMAALLFLLPAVAMQFTGEVNWTASDFVFAAVMLGSVGLAFELIVRKSPNLWYRFGAIVAVITSFLTIWVNGAVGMIGSEDNPYNLIFLGVIPLALIGSVLARFRPGEMVWAMAAAAVVQGVAGAIGIASDPLGGIFSTGFAGLWLLAAALFWNSSRQLGAEPAEPARK